MVHTSAPPSPELPQSQSDTKVHLSATRSACPLKTHIFSLWASSTAHRQVRTFKTNKHTHSLGSGFFTTPVTPRAADAFTKSHLVTTPSEPTTATRQWRCASRPLLHHARLCGRDSDKAINTTASPMGSQVHPSRFSTHPPLPALPPCDETCGKLLRTRCQVRICR